MFSLEEYDYTLPDELIAQEAIHPHHDARVIVVDKKSGEKIAEDTFWNLEEYIPADRVIYLNNSRVLPARIPLKGVRITREDGSTGTIEKGEILFCKMLGEGRFEAMVRPGAKFRKNTKIHFPLGDISVVDMSDTGRILLSDKIIDIMKAYGELPLPPYITYTKEKEADYQTSFAKKEGSVAAPTASLHFTQALLEKIKNPKHYVSLHVGLGTFKGIDTPDIRDYQIHGEMIEVDREIFMELAELKAEDKKILAIGTTVCRTLESLPHLWRALSEIEKSGYSERVQDFWDTLSSKNIRDNMVKNIIFGTSSIVFESQIYIYPGIDFSVVDDLITNFHLPKSSLLVLVSTFFGKENTMRLYEYVIEKKYRFFSFGDGMYIKK